MPKFDVISAVLFVAVAEVVGLERVAEECIFLNVFLHVICVLLPIFLVIIIFTTL